MKKSAFSTIFVHTLLFIAAAIVTYIFISSMYKGIYNIQGAFLQNQEAISNKLRTIINIDSCYYDPYNDILYIYVTNRGSTSLPLSNMILFIDGIYTPIANINLVRNLNYDSYWDPQEVIEVSATYTNIGTHSIKFIVSNGAYDKKLIRIYANGRCTVLE